VLLGPLPEDGSTPSIWQRLFPRITWKALTTVISFIDIIMFIVTLIVGGAKFDGAFVSENDMGGPSGTTLRYMGAKFGKK
jgi:hypothetical protein